MVERLTKPSRLRLAVATFVISVLLFVVAVGVSLFIRSSTIDANCEAIQENNQIFREFVQHSKQRSIAVVRDGEIANLTVAEIRAFYDPTIARIDAVSC